MLSIFYLMLNILYLYMTIGSFLFIFFGKNEEGEKASILEKLTAFFMFVTFSNLFYISLI